MANTISIIVYPAKDLEATKKFFRTYLGTEPYADAPYYVGYRVSDMEIGLDPNGSAVISYIEVDDIASSLNGLQEIGGKVVKDSTDVGGGLLIAQVEIEGNILGLRQQPK
jgi:predicted enzyme related to lactoylglutathione lyase